MFVQSTVQWKLSITMNDWAGSKRPLIISGCPPVVSGASAGVIYSPNFLWNHPSNKSCYWQITVPRQQEININFTFFNNNEEGCGSSYVDILDIHSDSVIRSSWLCETPIQPSFAMTYSGSIGVRFSPGCWETSSFLAFFQLRYQFPSPYTTYATTQPTNPASACKPVSSKFS